ncbi:Clr5 domain containing protein [Naviculisporaceae sp. PSN 640]
MPTLFAGHNDPLSGPFGRVLVEGPFVHAYFQPFPIWLQNCPASSIGRHLERTPNSDARWAWLWLGFGFIGLVLHYLRRTHREKPDIKPGYATKQNAQMPRRLVPSDEQWEAQKERIIELYKTDNKSLDWVMQAMQDRYKFQASRKMYKRRLRLWGVRKYFTKEDVPEINRQREMGSRSGHLILPGRGVVDLAKAESYMRRSASSRHSRHRQPQETAMCHLSMSPLPASSPPEAFFHSIETYLDIFSPDFIWYKDMRDRLCISGAGGISGRFRLSRFHDRILVAVNGFTYHSSPAELKKSREVMESCMEEMRIILIEQDPFLLPDIFHILLQIRNRPLPKLDPHNAGCGIPRTQDGKLELDQVLVKYGRDLSAITLPENHPLTLVWSVLYDAIRLNSDADMVYSALELVLDRFQAQVGPYHAISLIMRLHLFGFRGDSRWKQALSDLLTILESGWSTGKGFGRLKRILEVNEFEQHHVTAVTKFVCRLLRARLCSELNEGKNSVFEDDLLLDPETEVIQCLATPPTVHC